MSGIQAIQTAYKGRMFRSRTEARWAVFFDDMQWKWEYEKEGYELPSGRYLPDFYLPWHELWVEIKPDSPNEREMTLMSELAGATSRRAIILIGQPSELDHSVLIWDETGRRRNAEKGIGKISRCRRCNGVCLRYADCEPKRWIRLAYHECEDHNRWPYAPDEEFRAALSVRFEFGEAP